MNCSAGLNWWGNEALGTKALPFVAAVTGHRQKTVEVRPQRGEPGGMLADVALAVGIHDVLGGHFPARHGLLKLLPVACTVQREGAEIARRAGLCSYPAQGQCAFAVFPQHGAVARVLHADGDRSGTANG